MFQEDPVEPFKKLPGEVMAYDEHSSFTVDVIQTSFHKSFQSDNHVYCDLNNSILDFFLSSFIEIVFKLEIVLVVIVQLLYEVMHQVDY